MKKELELLQLRIRNKRNGGSDKQETGDDDVDYELMRMKMKTMN